MKQSTLVLVITFVFTMGNSLLNAQKGHGGGSSMGGGPNSAGHGTMTAPGQAPMPQSSGAASNPKDENRTGSRPELASGRTPAPQSASNQLSSNPKLASKLQTLFPNNTNLSVASTGFKSLGDFVSAAHVSHNLGIPFDQLKAKMIGGEELGQAIHDLRPDVDAKSEAA